MALNWRSLAAGSLITRSAATIASGKLTTLGVIGDDPMTLDVEGGPLTVTYDLTVDEASELGSDVMSGGPDLRRSRHSHR